MITLSKFLHIALRESSGFRVDELNGWRKGFKNIIAPNKQASEHVSELRTILSKPRSALTDTDRATLKTKFSEHPFNGGGGRMNNEELSLVRSFNHNTYHVSRYHLPSSKGLPTGRVVLVAAHAKDHSHVQLVKIFPHG